MSRGAHAYDSLAGASRALGEGALLIDEGLCLNLRGRQALCHACSDSCASAALTLTPDQIALDESLCSACGACLPVCPTGALRLSGFVPRRFVESLQGHETVHLHCSRSGHGGGGVVIPCHRVLDARLLAAGAAQGTQRFLLHGLDQCAGCERGDARPAVETIGNTLAAWLSEQAPEIRAAADGESEAGARRRQDQVAMSRRNFLRMAGAQSALNAAQWFAPVAVEDDEEAELLPFYQGDGELRRPAAYQALLAEQAVHLPWRPQTLPWRARRIDAACTGCRTCAARCPSGALEAQENAERVAISFRLDLCTDCDLCAALCPAQAIRPRPVPGPESLGEPRHVLSEHAQIRCSHCGHPYVGADDDSDALCVTCRNEQEIDADWLAMLGSIG